MKYHICVCSVLKMRIFLPQGQFSQKTKWIVREDGALYTYTKHPKWGRSTRLWECRPDAQAPHLSYEQDQSWPPWVLHSRIKHSPLGLKTQLSMNTHPQRCLLFFVRSYYSSSSDFFLPCSFHPWFSEKSEQLDLLWPSYHPRRPQTAS